VPGRPPPRRPPNRLVTDYDADVARRVAALAARRARSRDPELISLARDVIDPPPTNNAGYKMFRVTESPQSIEVDRLLQRLVSSACDKPSNFTLLTRLKGQICNGCRRRSVRRPSRGHISKTKQDRPVVTMEHCRKLASPILLPHSDFPDAHRGDFRVSISIQNMFNH